MTEPASGMSQVFGPLTLSIAPTTRGLGYVVIENETDPIDWGVKEVRRDKNATSLRRLVELIHLFEPSCVVLEDASAPGSRRRSRIRELVWEMSKCADERGVHITFVARTKMLAHFKPRGAKSKDQIAATVARDLPLLAPDLPKPRQIWETERRAMAVFDAAANALTWFAHRAQR